MAKMETLQAAAEELRRRFGQSPQAGVVLGSGLGGLADRVQEAQAVGYEELPGMKPSTAPGHRGRFVLGKLGGKTILLMQGRLHLYEGHTMEEIVFPVRLMGLLGIRALVVTNAAGGVNLSYRVGDLMLMEDHINLMGTNPLIGPNLDCLGERFPDMSRAYSPALRALAKAQADRMGLELREGVYAGLTGPSYETPAEIRMLRILGADAVGMSTVPEVIAARHMGIEVLGISLITNMAAGVLDQTLSGEEVIAVGRERGSALQALVEGVLEEMEL